MKKYLAFARVSFIEQFKKLFDEFGTIFSFCIHITIFSFLWDFVLEGKELAGYTKQELIWYVIMAEAIMYSYHNYYRKVAYKVEMGDFAYDMTKPFNFLGRTIVEGLAELPMTFTLLVTGGILGAIFTGLLPINLVQTLFSILIMLLSSIMLLVIHIVIGVTSIWLGRDVSSVWLLCQKAMLIFAFTPIELFPKAAQNVLLLLPTTHVIYTPASLFVHFSSEKLVSASIYVLSSFTLLAIVLWAIYKKGVKKQNVNGI
jgi:ABC-2 type transport system permease protein